MKQKIKLIGIIVVVLIISIFGVIKGKKYYDNKKEEERLAKDPYFTEYKLSWGETIYMAKGFYCEFKPKIKSLSIWWDNLDKSKWPYYSFYTMTATEDTEKAVAALNYDLFYDTYEDDDLGKERAKEMGFTSENRLTVDWVMSHPKEAVDIIDGMANNGSWFLMYEHIKSAYEKIISGTADDI